MPIASVFVVWEFVMWVFVMWVFVMWEFGTLKRVGMLVLISLAWSWQSMGQVSSSLEGGYRSARNRNKHYETEQDRVKAAESRDVVLQTVKLKVIELLTLAHENTDQSSILGEVPGVETIAAGSDFSFGTKDGEDASEVYQAGPLYYEASNTDLCRVNYVHIYNWGLILDSNSEELQVRCQSKTENKSSREFRAVRLKKGVRLLELRGWDAFNEKIQVK